MTIRYRMKPNTRATSRRRPAGSPASTTYPRGRRPRQGSTDADRRSPCRDLPAHPACLEPYGNRYATRRWTRRGRLATVRQVSRCPRGPPSGADVGREVLAGEGGAGGDEVGGRALEDDPAAVVAGAGAEVDD